MPEAADELVIKDGWGRGASSVEAVVFLLDSQRHFYAVSMPNTAVFHYLISTCAFEGNVDRTNREATAWVSEGVTKAVSGK